MNPRAHALPGLQGPLAWIMALLCALLLGGCAGPQPAAPQSATHWPQPPRAEARTVAVFVHGVMGDADTTWRAAPGAPGWPELVARDPELAGIDVLALGYRSPPLGKASSIEEIAVRSLGDIVDRGVFKRYDNVVFVVHSMGGLVTKRMLATLKNRDRAAFDKVRAVVFFATPAGGSSVAALADWMSSNPQFRDMAPADFSSFLQVLENDWQALLKSRSPAAPFPRAYCAYETLPAFGMKVIVPRSAAQAGCDDTPVAFDRDHGSIVKPASLDDEVHRYLKARILQSLDPALAQLQVSLQVLNANGEQLREGSVLRDRDQYSMQLRATPAAWFYVFGVDSTDRVTRLFPSPATGSQSAAVGYQRIPHQAPGEPELFLDLDANKGVERLYIFARSQPDPSLAALGATVGLAQADPATRAKLERTFMSMRGVGSVSPRRLDQSGQAPLARVPGGATEVFLFEHR